MTSDERRDIAATMRIISGEGVRNLTLGEVLNSILTGGAPRPMMDMDILACLADLIDQTGTNEIVRYGLAVWHRCSMCEEPIDSHVNYCPNCGARLVSADDVNGD